MSPAATTDVGKTSKKGKIQGKDSKEKITTTKLCHIVKRFDFDGYGFNLQTEKSRPGQYIGKVDENSPAEAAGLREGYRVIEVNGIPVGNETHKQVVQRIKAIAWEVKLLVSTDVTDITNTIIKTSQKDTKLQNSANNNNDAINFKTTKSDKKEQNSNGTGGDPIKAVTAIKTSGVKLNTVADNIADTQIQAEGHTNVKTTSPSQSLTPSSRPEGDATLQNSQKPQSSELKLPSTAAEMRAILQSKKKYNPKNEDVDLQKKYEIIKKL